MPRSLTVSLVVACSSALFAGEPRDSDLRSPIYVDAAASLVRQPLPSQRPSGWVYAEGTGESRASAHGGRAEAPTAAVVAPQVVLASPDGADRRWMAAVASATAPPSGWATALLAAIPSGPSARLLAPNTARPLPGRTPAAEVEAAARSSLTRDSGTPRAIPGNPTDDVQHPHAASPTGVGRGRLYDRVYVNPLRGRSPAPTTARQQGTPPMRPRQRVDEGGENEAEPVQLTPVPQPARRTSPLRSAPARIPDHGAMPRGSDAARVPPDAPLSVGPPRSHHVETVARDCDAHSRRAFELAGRRAYFSARIEYLEALRFMAQALDATETTGVHVSSLVAGLRALDEADDFTVRAGSLITEIDVAAIVRGHHTRILKAALPESITPLEALQRYYTFAQEQLAASVSGEFAGSIALYGLGKVHDKLAAEANVQFKSPRAKSMVFHQAALLANPRNFMAANDLGVLLGRMGRLEEARRVLQFSLSIVSQPASWQSLAEVHRRLGEYQLSSLAAQEAVRAAQWGRANTGTPSQATQSSGIVWLDPEAFSRIPSTDMFAPSRTTRTTQTVTQSPATVPPQGQLSLPGALGKALWSRRSQTR